MNFIQKTTVAAGVALAMGLGATGTAQALSITDLTMQFYDAAGTRSPAGGGLNSGVVGSLNDAVTGTMTSGTTPFFGTAWNATQEAWIDNHDGASRWNGTSASGVFDYNFTLTGNQVAVGIYFNWGAASEIAVLQIFDCPDGAAGACVGVHNPAGDDLPASALHPDDHPNVPGSWMVNGPFTGQHATFSGSTADIFPQSGTTVIPVPAAVWLFGSGLVGLVGVARRRTKKA